MKETLNPYQKEFCLSVVEKIQSIPISCHFNERVNEKEVPEYYKIIKHPMWLNEVLRKINDEEYKSPDQWKSDMELIWKNAKTFNKPPEYFISTSAVELQKVFEEMTKSIPSTAYELWLKRIEHEQKILSKMLREMPGYYRPNKENEKEKTKDSISRTASKNKL